MVISRACSALELVLALINAAVNDTATAQGQDSLNFRGSWTMLDACLTSCSSSVLYLFLKPSVSLETSSVTAKLLESLIFPVKLLDHLVSLKRLQLR